MKYRSSNRPTASASARRTSKQAPLTQSTHARPARQSLHVTAHESALRGRCRGRAASDAVRQTARSSSRTTVPHDPCPSTRRGPATAASGSRLEDLAAGASMAPGRSSVSGFSTSTNPPDDCRMPMLLARAKPRFARGIDHASRQASRCRTALAGAVGRGVVDDHRLVVQRRKCRAADSRHASICPTRVVSDDDDRETSGTSISPTLVTSMLTRTDTPEHLLGARLPRIPGQQARRRLEDPGTFGVVEQRPLDSGLDERGIGSRHVDGRILYTSRATGVSRTTIGTPAASASRGVRPNPSYSERKTNARARL